MADSLEALEVELATAIGQQYVGYLTQRYGAQDFGAAVSVAHYDGGLFRVRCNVTFAEALFHFEGEPQSFNASDADFIQVAMHTAKRLAVYVDLGLE